VTTDEEQAAYGGDFAFDFFEVLEVAGGKVLPRGSLVCVLGRVREDDGTEWYSVTPNQGDSCMISAPELRATGRHLRREDFYDGSAVRVSQEGELLGEE
jgi:hypothetical protein